LLLCHVKTISVRAGQKISVLGYNKAMFAACPLSLSIASAALASKAARATITKTTTIKG
jgi:hypothetical protein